MEEHFNIENDTVNDTGGVNNMANKIQIRRGLKANLPVLDVGEPALCTDTKEVYVGNAAGNVQLVNKETLDAHLGNYILQIPYASAGGSANSYSVTLNPAMVAYTEGAAVAVKINITNTGASTININGMGAKSIRDSKGNALTAGKLVANSIYTLRYNGTNFILQGEGGEYGTAGAGQVLSGYTVGTDSGLVNGTMTNNGAVSQSLAVNSSYTIPAGYHNGSGKVTQTIATKAAETYSPGTAVQTIPAGQYLSGVQTINPVTGTATAADVTSGKTFCSAAGIYLTGTNTNKPYAILESVAPNTSGIQFTLQDGTASSFYTLTVTGLSFTPKTIIVTMTNNYQPYLVVSTEMPKDTNGYTIIWFEGGTDFYVRLTGNAYITNGSFQLPVSNGVNYKILAIG